MIKLCKNLFYKPKYSSDADSIMLKHLFSTVTVVLICLAAISFSAYAFFSHSVTSASNTLKASNFSTTVTIETIDGTPITQGKIDTCRLDPDRYTVTIAKDPDTTGTGFCAIRIGDVAYYTQQLGKDLNAPKGERNEISFILDIQVPTTVEIDSRWGTTSYYASATESEFYIKNTDPLQVIAVNATQNIADNTEGTKSEEKAPEETTPEETTPEKTTPEETTPEETTPEETTPEETTPTTDPEETTSPTEQKDVVHIVAAGEILSEIAAQNGMHHTRVAAYNGILPPYEIYPGDEIKIPPADWVMPEVTE